MTRTAPIYLGTTADGLRVEITIELRPFDRPQHFRTVEHTDTPADAVELSICGMVWQATKSGARDRRYADAIGGGQIIDYARDVSRVARPYSRADVARLVAIWEKWHLNGMRAACAHMTLPADTSYDARKGITCARVSLVKGTGPHYRYGRAWLFEPLPADVLEFVHDFIARATA